MHALRDAQTKSSTKRGIVEYEAQETRLREERAQLAELDCLNYLAQKQIVELLKKVPTESEVITLLGVHCSD